jgi:mannose-6-phosphate isomerase-like protein (cupin superfamily)
MPQYIFSEEEWLDWTDEYTSATLVGIDGQEYGLIKHRSMKARLPGSDTYDRFLGVNTFGPGGVYEAHAHETPMFYYVLTGRAKMRVGDEERIVERGAWVYTPPGMAHYTENIGDDDLSYILFGGNPKSPDSKAHEAVKRSRHSDA